MDEQKQNPIFITAMPSPVMTKEPEATDVPVATDAPADAAAETDAQAAHVADDMNVSGDGSDGDMQVPSSTKRLDDEMMADAGENKSKVVLRALRAIEESLVNVIKLLEEEGDAALPAATMALNATNARLKPAPNVVQEVSGRVVEGVFNGQHMVGSDGKIYSVPPNYASKSKLVEGDMLKLTISNTGSFIYKQIGPIDRRRVVGALGYDQTTGEYYVTSDDKRWSCIKASVTYFKGEAGDEVVLLVPMDAPSKWGAVENIIRKTPL